MPDWSYRTLFRPLLFRLKAAHARDLTLKTFGRVGRMPGGSFIIRTFGHMETSPLLASKIGNTRIKYPVGLSGELDPHGDAHEALAQIGFGFIEIGPIALRDNDEDPTASLDIKKESILYTESPVCRDVQSILDKLNPKHLTNFPYMFRLRPLSDRTLDEKYAEIIEWMKKLSGRAAAFYIDVWEQNLPFEKWVALIEMINDAVRSENLSTPLFLYIPLAFPTDKLQEWLAQPALKNWNGFVIGDGIETDLGVEFGKNAKNPAAEKVRMIATARTEHQTIVSKAGIHEPQDALDMLEAGADYIQLHSGLIYSGPGLPKRINEAIYFEKVSAQPAAKQPAFWKYWGWMCLLGIGMMLGGVLAWISAVTSVLLPYDERFLGITHAEIHAAYPQLLHFMSHDRITLAGTMISIGVLYFMLGRYGLRSELHWAKTAAFASGIVGFSSFFLYLGYGYFDPLHALAAVILLPMFVLSMRGRAVTMLVNPPNLRNDRAWILAQWGQLMLIILGFAFAIGGITISTVGITHVFVQEDLGYLQLTPVTIREFNQRLIPLIAHDRAGFGGALLCDAIAVLAAALWGIRQGERWIWWMFLLSGMPGFAAVFSVHGFIGYTDFIHLLPAYFAFLVYVLGLLLLFPYLMRTAGK